MRAVLLFVLGVLIGGCGHPRPLNTPQAPPTQTEQVDDLGAKTVALVQREPFTRPFCTGVWVGPHSILTAYHCTAVGSPFEYVVHDDVYAPNDLKEQELILPRPARLVAADPEHDLALLWATDAPAHPVATVSLDSIYAGQSAQAMGMSLGLWWSYSSGDVSAIRSKPLGGGLDFVWVQTTTPTSLGNSGGGLFDRAGRLIGLCHGQLPRGQMLNIYIHAQYLDAFIRRQTVL